MATVDAFDKLESKLDEQLLYIHCVQCKQKLSCPRNTLIVECPICNELIMPYSEYIINCITCGKKLFYPPTAQVIQCSNKECFEVMDVSLNPVQKCNVSIDGKITKNVSEQFMNDYHQQTAMPYRTAFDFWMNRNEQNVKYANMSSKMRRKQLEIDWNNISLIERNKYISMSINDRKKYFKELAKWKEQNNDEQSDQTSNDEHFGFSEFMNLNESSKTAKKNEQKVEKIMNENTNVSITKSVSTWNIDDICLWLRQIGMEKYVKTLRAQFIEDGIIGSDLMFISMLDLQDYGIRDANDKRWILQSIRLLN